MIAAIAAISLPAIADDYWQHEAKAACHDLQQESVFHLPDVNPPYRLALAVKGQTWQLAVSGAEQQAKLSLQGEALAGSMAAYRRICARYYRAARGAGLDELSVMDKARRAAHVAGAQSLIQALGGNAQLDESTAKKLFTLLCALPPS